MQTRKGVKEYTLGVNPITVGRLPANTLSFKSDEKMSRTHFIIKPSTEGYSITDLNSANGTFVNGERITERILKEGDKIQAGQTIFIFKEK